MCNYIVFTNTDSWNSTNILYYYGSINKKNLFISIFVKHNRNRCTIQTLLTIYDRRIPLKLCECKT